MADSGITKRALAAALKNLVATAPLSKVSVGDICAACDMNRKSFYYHFKDKEDLVNWIFDTEFAESRERLRDGSVVSLLELLAQYLYTDRAFWRKIIKHEGQNCFSEHLCSVIRPVIADGLESVVGEGCSTPLQLDALTDSALCLIKRWMAGAECVTPEELIRQIRDFIYPAARLVLHCEEAERAV